ncbi:MAG: isoleucine--tRNA ligase [Flavobacteriia bacterium]|nr:isoleucine--tRNA ligase [Flavobacteriia bacterium]OIP45482.1 MAG: isoleucine--tRNA ligase [Flavobacteriaceae bacterium CG2_30_31_66]PIV97645.1 MAG: isoleucine--tRNA ligase [Flavobacteriaceae bacterium CG17_big_fil_post_rev_8_21_14_2_50_31_13]PIZ11752.1 MAG: isoleucine--tRNA ligase [Flavobacteriaceae bacterium CG_4_10_14_0_8_um_filter_31_99]PJC11118.1 MAG: isoleucine--tRNA ligase [Flavobacteriaceae bacterium CG_4_9_14_0_8_um_filter_31_91]
MSAKFPEYKALDLPKVAEEILEYWNTNNIFEKSISLREGNTPFVFFEGPPSANGLPGVHHVLARAIKDIFPRYKTMKGFQVKRKAGWDTHGLPIELGVEKELGITKEDIGKIISVEDYNAACRKAVMRYTDIWNDLTQKMGYWVDVEHPYITYEPKYMESVWWLLKQIYNKNLLYKGYTIQPYSPKAGTGLSSHELNQPGTYQDVTDTTVVAQFKAINETLPDFLQNEGTIYFLAWTTTPWTLPSNTALTVGPKIDYVLVDTFNQYTFEPTKVILAKNLVSKQFAGKFKEVEHQSELDAFKESDKFIPYKIIATCVGKDLVGIKYEQLMDYVLPNDHPENAFRVISGDFVTTEDGTGIVHTAPTFGADDAFVAKQAIPEIPPMLVKDDNGNLVPLVDLQGKFRPEVTDLAGKYVKNDYYNDGEAPEKSVDVEIAIKLKFENKAFKVEKYKHSYPNCWRTDKPILYYPLDSWFIKATQVKEKMHEFNKTINWKPESTGTGRFGNWLANANDWNLSRSRYWGIPLPIWRTEDGKEEICIGSVEELKNEMAKAVKASFLAKDIFEDFEIGNNSEENYAKIDLHKNIVDEIILVSASGKPMKRESDLIDVWFDSGAMPYAQWHYPFENKDLIDKNEAFPADFIAEGVDQTRGWFYTLHAIATMVFDTVAYKNVVSNGLVLDKNGQKMSKRLGNAVDPFTTLSTFGADATRWYMISNANPWDNLKFDLEGIEEVKRKFFGTLYNTYSFFSLYTNIDGFAYLENEIPLENRPELDRWILSELHTLIQNVDQFYTEYEPTRAARAISDFTQEYLSNWYVRLSRRRFWKGDYETDKISAYQTLYTCLMTIAKLGAPIAPFFMDKLYQDLNSVTQKENTESIHLADFPVFDERFVDKNLEKKMQMAQKIASLVLSLRAKEKIKVRQPLQKIMIPVDNLQQKEAILAVANLIKHEVNIKEIALLEDASDLLIKQIKPNFKTLGPKFGKDMGLIANKVQNFSKEDINKIEKEGTISMEINGKNINLGLEDVEISSKDIAGWLVANEGSLTVALDVTLTDDLRKEGIARELVNRIQNARKDSGFEVTDKIKLTVLNFENLQEAISDNKTYIMSETLTQELVFVDELNTGVVVEFDNIVSKIVIEKM